MLGHPELEQLALPLNFDTDSSRYLTRLLVGQPLLRRTLALQMHEPYLTQQLKAAGVTQPLLDDTARQALYPATKGVLRRVNKLALMALRLAASRKAAMLEEAILLDPTAEALL